LHGDAGTQAAADHGDAVRIDLAAGGQPVVQQAAVFDHVDLGRHALRFAVAAVVHRQHGHVGEQLAGVAHDPGHFFGAAAEIQDRRARTRNGRRHQPAGKAGAVGGAQDHGAGAVAAAARALHFALERRIEYQAALVGGHGRGQSQPQHAGKARDPRRHFLRHIHD